MIRPTLINLYPGEPKHYLLMIGLDKCSANCNVSSPKACVSKIIKRHKCYSI